jgi:predicted anti-sigma-YlaC factor YlaD
MTPCEHRDALHDYVDGLLKPAESRRFEGHLATCASCTGDVALVRRVIASLESLPLIEPPLRVTEHVLDRVLPSRQRRRAWVRRASWAYAGVLAACLIGVALWAMQPGSLPILSTIGGTASRRVVQIMMFTLNAGSSTVLHLASSWGFLAAAGNNLAPLGRAIGSLLIRPSVGVTLWLAATACAALLWWMRPRRHDGNGGMRHVGVLGF